MLWPIHSTIEAVLLMFWDAAASTHSPPGAAYRTLAERLKFGGPGNTKEEVRCQSTMSQWPYSSTTSARSVPPGSARPPSGSPGCWKVTLEKKVAGESAGESGQCQIPPAETVGKPMRSGHRESLAAHHGPCSVHEHTAGFGLLLDRVLPSLCERNFVWGVHLQAQRVRDVHFLLHRTTHYFC